MPKGTDTSIGMTPTPTHNNMKKPTPAQTRIAVCTLALFGLMAWMVSTASAQTPLPIYEPFPASYTNGTPDETVPVPADGNSFPARRMRIAPTTTLWSIGGAAGGGSPLAVGGAAALSYPGLFQTPGSIGCFIRTNNTTATRSPGIYYSTVSNGTLYASLLLNVQTSPSASDPNGPNRLFAKMDSSTTGTGGSSMAGIWLTSNNTLALSKSSNTAPSADTGVEVGTNTTHLLVLRYTWNPDVGDDEVALWVDPPAGSLNAPEGSVPAPTLTTVSGNDVTSLSSFYFYHIGSEVVASMFLDEVRLGTTWAEVTSTQALCVAASIATPPASQTVNEGIGATLSCVAGGTTPTFQWQVSTNSGASWDNVSTGLGGTSQTYLTPPSTPADNGKQYRVIASVACGNTSSATSSVATVTVVNAAPTGEGVVVDDVFQDTLYNNLPYGISNSVWFAGVASSLDASSGISMIGTVPASSVNWVGYFTDDSVTNLPVHLEVGRALKATLVFNGTGITASNGSVRIGLFDYAEGATRLTADGFGNNVSAQNVRGYMVSLNYGTNFSGNPFSLYARNNLAATDLMGTTGDYLNLGGGPGGYAGAPAFQDTTNYTLGIMIARRSLTSVEVTASITGGGTNWTHSRVDNIYAYPRFDAVAFRAANAAQAANQFEFTRLLVEVVAAAPNPEALNITSSGGNVTLSWTSPLFHLQAAPEVTATYTNVPGATSPYTTSAGEVWKFFRLSYP